MSTDNNGRRITQLNAALLQANNALREKMDELSLVRRVGDAISQHTSVWSLSSELVEALAKAINCKYAFIYAGQDASSFELQAVSSIFSGDEKFPVAMLHRRLAEYLEQTDPLQIPDLAKDATWSHDWPFPKTLASWLCIGLGTRNHQRGILCLADSEPKAFDDRTLRVLMMVAPQISSAFSNIGLYNHVRESEGKYRTLVTRMQDVVYICNRDWQILDANPAANALFGGPITGKSLTELFASPNAASEFVEAVRRSRSVQNFETRLLSAANENIVVLLSCVGDSEGYSGIIKDVTERTQLMEQVARAQKMDSMGTLAAGVAHDCSNILAIILPHAELIRNQVEPDSQAARSAGTILEASKSAAQLTRQLLSLSWNDAVAFRPINVNEAVRTTEKLLSESINRNISLEFDLSSEAAMIKADETQFQQVLLNLAINARDAMPDGGALKFTTRCEGANVIVRIGDTGAGIDSVTLPKIFDPFFTTKNKSKGSGLGLTVVYRIVKQAGGAIDVKSEVGVGTEFSLVFPSSNESRHRTARQRGRTKDSPAKILIADDEPEILNLMESVLTDLGYTVICARNGIDAVEQAEDDVKLIILDMIMPEMDGLAALRRIRDKLPHVKILISSGYTSPEKTPLLLSLGIQGFIPKPFQLAKLSGAVRDVLDGVAV